jgi:hypothetical protein
MFETRDGVLWEIRPGKPPSKICSAFEIESVVCDNTRLLWALDCWALDVDGHLIRVRILPRHFYAISTMSLEQTFAAAGLYLWNTAALVRFLRGNIPAVEPLIVSDLRASDDDFREGACRRFRVAFERTKLFHGAA